MNDDTPTDPPPPGPTNMEKCLHSLVAASRELNGGLDAIEGSQAAILKEMRGVHEKLDMLIEGLMPNLQSRVAGVELELADRKEANGHA